MGLFTEWLRDYLVPEPKLNPPPGESYGQGGVSVTVTWEGTTSICYSFGIIESLPFVRCDSCGSTIVSGGQILVPFDSPLRIVGCDVTGRGTVKQGLWYRNGLL